LDSYKDCNNNFGIRRANNRVNKDKVAQEPDKELEEEQEHSMEVLLSMNHRDNHNNYPYDNKQYN
jgi:hypothetical protein